MLIYNAIILLFENSQQSLQKYSLDGTDLKILTLLAANGRLSYRSIGLTTKSVKSRVDRMLVARVIDRFLTRVNPSVIGYNRICAFALRKNKLTQEILDRINLIGNIQYQFEVMGGAVGLEIGDIAAATAITPKTVRRRLDKMTRNHVLEFSILPNPDAMKGYVFFFLDVRIKNRGHHQHVLQRIYEELHEHFMPLSSDMSNQEDSIGLLLGSEDAIGIESIRSRIESLDGVEQANAFLPIKLACPQEWIVKAIDKNLESAREGKKSLGK